MTKGNNTLAFDASVSVRTVDNNGYLHVNTSNISKAAVNPYLGREIPGWEERGLKPDEIYFGLRDPEELSKAASTFNGLPLLLNHHPIDSANIPKETIIGSTGTDAAFKAPYLINSMTIYDAAAIKLIEDGEMKELSCAYSYVPDFTAGEYGEENTPYDFVMRDIRGNHLALVRQGRAGKDVYVKDSLPEELKNGGTENMSNKKSVMNFKKKRAKIMANDAELNIEGAEVRSAGFVKAVNVIEAQVEGYDPREVGLEIDKNATVDEIIDKFIPGLSDEQKVKYRNILNDLKGGTAADEDSPIDNNTSAGEDDELEDERFKNPDFKAGFEEGVRYGEKREKADPERIDRDHEREGEERYLAQDTIENIKSEAVKQARLHVRSLNMAANKVRSLVGNLKDPMNFDSAEEIYKFALEKTGVRVSEYPSAAYEGMVDIAIKNKPIHNFGLANDSIYNSGNVEDGVAKALSGLDRISY